MIFVVWLIIFGVSISHTYLQISAGLSYHNAMMSIQFEEAQPQSNQSLLTYWIIVMMLIYSLWATSVNSPGYAKCFQDRFRSKGMPVSQAKANGCRRYCRVCKIYKPDRTHHCHQCNTCILNFDHHCGFLSNCIGHYNYKYFLTFLFWGIVTCAFGGFQQLSSIGFRPSSRLPYWIKYPLLMNALFYIAFGLILGMFLIFHVYMLCINSTTFELMEQHHRVINGRVMGNKFNVGIWNNIKQKLGPNFFLWFLPMFPPPVNPATDNDGLSFQLNVPHPMGFSTPVKATGNTSQSSGKG